MEGKFILFILCAIIPVTTQIFAADLTREDRDVLYLAAAHPDLAVELAKAYPHLGNEIINSAEKNQNKLRTRQRKNQTQLRTALAKTISWGHFACQELNTEQEYLISEAKYPRPIGCASEMVTEDSDNPGTVNSAQNEANGVDSSFQQGLITEEEAQQLINEITADGSQIVNPLPASGS